MPVFMICERALGLIRGKRLELTGAEKNRLEALDYEGLLGASVQEEAVSCVRHFAGVRDRLLSLYPWVFARKTAAPAQLAGTPPPGWQAAPGGKFPGLFPRGHRDHHKPYSGGGGKGRYRRPQDRQGPSLVIPNLRSQGPVFLLDSPHAA